MMLSRLNFLIAFKIAWKRHWLLYIIITCLSSFYLVVCILSNGFIQENETAEAKEASIDISVSLFLILWLFLFFETSFMINRLFIKEIRKKRAQIMLLSSLTKRSLYLGNIYFLMSYIFSRMLLFFVIVVTTYAFKTFLVKELILLIFNILINSFFIATFITWFFLWSINAFSFQYLIMNILGGSLIFISNMGTATLPITSSSGLFLTILRYFPFIGVTSPYWIITNQWQQYLNIPFSILGSIFFIFLGLKEYQEIDY